MKRWLFAPLILVLLALLLVGCGSGGGSTTSSDNGDGQSTSGGPISAAEQAACSANRRTISSSIQQYNAMEGKSATSIQQLVPKYLQSVPACPAGGTYSLQGTTVTCSVHGS